MSPEATDFARLLENFGRNTPGIRHTLVVSSDGLVMAASAELDRTSADHLSAVVAGLSGLTRGAARQLRAGAVRQSIVEMDTRFLFLMSIADGPVLATVADATCDVGLVGYEMALLAGRSGRILTPGLVAEMRARLPVSGPTRAGVTG